MHPNRLQQLERQTARAQAAVADSYPSAAAQKEAIERVRSAYSVARHGIRDILIDVPTEARGEAWENLYWYCMPDLAGWRAKHGAAIVAAYPAAADLVAKLDAFAALRATIKAKPIIKPETKKAAAEKAVAATRAAIEAGTASPIALAIAPLRERAIAAAKAWAEKSAEGARARLADFAFDPWAAVPEVGRDAGEVSRAVAESSRAHLLHFVETTDGSTWAWSDERAASFVARAMRDTGMDFDAFVVKLDGKVGQHVAAELVTGATWAYSLLRVTLADGRVEKWQTRQIINHSPLGLAFNQWPTRIVK